VISPTTRDRFTAMSLGRVLLVNRFFKRHVCVLTGTGAPAQG